MIAKLVLLVVELIFGCHCRHWMLIGDDYRCTVVVEHCELVRGWHYIAESHPVCTVDCGDWIPGERP